MNKMLQEGLNIEPPVDSINLHNYGVEKVVTLLSVQKVRKLSLHYSNNLILLLPMLSWYITVVLNKLLEYYEFWNGWFIYLFFWVFTTRSYNLFIKINVVVYPFVLPD